MQRVLGLLISIFGLVFFYFIFYRAYRIAFGKKFLKRLLTKKFVIAFSMVAFVGLLLVIFSISKNSFVYYWDYGWYWSKSYTFSNLLFSKPLEALSLLGDSIWNEEYNYVLPLIISLPLKVFGITFMRYVVINYLAFFVPAAFIIVSMLAKISEKKKQRLSWGLPLLTVATFAYPFLALLNGYIDIALLMPISLLFALAMGYNSLKLSRKNRRRGIMMGLLLVVTFVFRRYSAFFCVGFVLAILAQTILSLFRARKKNIRQLIKNAVCNYLWIGGVSVALLVVCLMPLIIMIISNNYADRYAAYDLPFGEKIASIVARFGIMTLILAAVGIIGSIFAKNKAYSKAAFVSLVCLVATTALFFRVQRMDPHHLYVITVPVMILSYLGVVFVYARKNVILKAFLTLVLLVQPAVFFFGTAQRAVQPFSWLFMGHYQPFFRGDMSEIARLVDYLNNQTSGEIYVLASGGVLNSDTINAFGKPYTEHAVPRLNTTHDVDLRDGFAPHFLWSDTIVTATPIQLHLPEGTQEVVRYLYEQVTDPTSYLGDNFEKLSDEFYLDNGVTVNIYHKVRDFEKGDYLKMSEYYDSLYPDYVKIFGDRIREYSEQ